MTKRERELVKEMIQALKSGKEVMEDVFSEEEMVISSFLGRVPAEMRWAEKAEKLAKEADRVLIKGDNSEKTKWSK